MLRKLYDMMHYGICASTQIVLEELFVQVERVMSRLGSARERLSRSASHVLAEPSH
jgi:hypothetical protein